MAENPKAEALRRNIAFIQESTATGGLSTIAGHLLQSDLITRQNYYDLATYGRGPVDQAAMLMRTVEVRIRDNPDVYFTRYIEALRRSHLGNVADRLVQALPEDQRHSTSHDMITSNVPSPSDSTLTTATSHKLFSSFSNQLSFRYPVPPTVSPYNPFSPYFLPVQQPVLPPSYSQAYLSSYPLQQGNDPTCPHAPSDFSFPPPPPNPVHLNQQYSVLPSHTNTPILHQNPSLSYEQHPLPFHPSSTSHPYHHRLSSQPFPLYSSTDPKSVTINTAATATSHHSLNPPDVHSLITSQVSSMTTLPKTPTHTQSVQSSNTTYHTEQSQSFLPHYSRQSYTSTCNSTITAYHSPAPPSPLATTPSGVTASPSTPAHQHHLSPAMQRYVSYLKNVYKNKTTPVYDKEHSLLHVKAKSFINIALVRKDFPQYRNDKVRNEMIMDRLHGHVDAIQETKTKLSISEVGKNQKGDLARSVLVEGAPGVGKTTFAYELCKRWARGEILWEWAAVVLIKLRDHTTRTAQNMFDLLYHPRPEVQQAVVDELIDHDGGCLLLILDGYDELTDSQKKSTSVIQRIMSKELLVQSTLMVTSRPLATRTLYDNFVQSIDQHIEVLGFTEKNIEKYIQSACGDKPELVEDFKSYLSCHPFSSALMFNPLQCAIVTDLYRSHWESGDKGFAPKSLTELYTGLVHIMLLRYLTQHPVYKEEYWRIDDLSDLPIAVSQQLKAVTELAAKGIRKRQYVFDEFNTNIPPETLGLMQKEEIVASGSGISTSHIFLHLTLQEYLAAVNYSQQYSSPEQLSQLLTCNDLFPLNNFLEYYGMEREETLYSSATHWPVVLFVAGRTKLSGVPTNIFKTGLHDDDDITTVDISLLHLLYETQSPQLIQSTLVTSRKHLSVRSSSALDWFVIGYCIANSTSTWRVEIDGNDSPKRFDQLVMGLRLGLEECSGESKIGCLYIIGHWTENWKILSQLQQYAKKVTELTVVCNKQRKTYDQKMNHRKLVVSEEVSACYPMLEKLSIKNVESAYFVSLLSFIFQHSNLHYLYLDTCNLSSTSTSSLIHFLQSPNNRLNKLTLDRCTIQIPDHTNSFAIYYKMELYFPGPVRNYFHKIKSSLHAINYILSQLTLFYASTLTRLKVAITSEEKFHTLLHDSVLQIILQHNTLRILLVRSYNLTCDNVRSLIHSLQSSHCGLQELTLDDCFFDHSHTTTSSELKLKSSDSGNVSLEFTGDCSDISRWLSQLSSYTQLTELILYLNKQDSADTLQEILLYHHVLESLQIERHAHLPFSIPQFIELQQNNLRNLSLSFCDLSSDVTRSLIHSLLSPNCRIHKLTIDYCKILTPKEPKQNTISTKNNTTLCSLVTTDSLCVLNHILSNVLFTRMTQLSLCITAHNSSVAEVLTKIPVLCPVLETIKIDSSVSLSLPLSIPQFIESQQSNLRTLSVCGCNLSSDVTWSLIHSMQSLHCRIQNLSLKKCTISWPKDTRQPTILTEMNVALHSLDISWSVLNQMMSCINPFTQSLTELILHVDNDTYTCTSGVETILQEVPSNCPLLEILRIDCDGFPLFIPHQFIGSQQNNLRTLSLRRCTLSSDVTTSLIHFLQSPHCKLYKLALYDCIIPTTEHTQLTTAIVSSTTITHLLFIDENIDTPSITALASGLKHNTTIEQLAVQKFQDKNFVYFTEDQFRLLIYAVDSSAVKTLWLYDDSVRVWWFSDFTFSRNNFDIESYFNNDLEGDDLYNKW